MKSLKSQLWLGLLGLGILAGLITAYRLFTTGLTIYGKTDVLVWTIPLGAYIFFSLTSAGLAFVSSIPMVFGFKSYEPIEKRTVFLEFAVLAGGMICLILHLGSPEHAFALLFSPNLTSPLWWLGTLYAVYLVLLVLTFGAIHAGRTSRILGMLLFLIAIATSTMLGALFAETVARPAYFGPFLTAYFPMTALPSGLAALFLVSLAYYHFAGQGLPDDKKPLYNDMAKLLGVVTGITLLFFVWRSIIAASTHVTEYDGFKHVVATVPYHLELWLGLVLPFVMMMIPKLRATTWAKVVASGSLLIGMFFARLELLLTGQIIPLGQMTAGRPKVVTYVPTIWEFFVVVFALAVMLLIYTFGEKYLKLEESA